MTTPPKQSQDSRQAETQAIEAILAGMVEAWDRGDAVGVGARLATDGTFINSFGGVDEGREEFVGRLAERFRGFASGTKAGIFLRKLQFVRPDVAVAVVLFETRGYKMLPPDMRPAPDGVLRGMGHLVFVRKESGWWITALQNAGMMPYAATAEIGL